MLFRRLPLFGSQARLPSGLPKTNSTYGILPRSCAPQRALSTRRPCRTDISSDKLSKIVSDSIKAIGPLPVSQYMQLCLSHPTEGYYMKGDVFGSKGDFITSPEISQVFGELVGIWLLSQWMEAGRPSNIRIVELGPGRGTLMEDILRTMLRLGGDAVKAALKAIHLVETSEKLAAVQRQKLEQVSSQGWTLTHCVSVDEIPKDESSYTMIVAHEFFDALPIHIMQNTDRGWREIFVGLDESPATSTILSERDLSSTTTLSASPKPKFKLGLAPGPSPMASVLSVSSPRFASRPIGSRLEVSPASWSIAKSASELLLGPGGGVGLIMDYGDETAFGDSFRAFRNHKMVDVFDEPGSSDLTASVDFAYLKEAMSSPDLVSSLTTQRDFLLKMGIEVRLERLLQGAADDQRRRDIRTAVNRLIDLTGMGQQYKFLAVTNKRNDDPDWKPYPFQAAS